MKILFSSNKKLIDFIKVRSFDVVNFVAYEELTLE